MSSYCKYLLDTETPLKHLRLFNMTENRSQQNEMTSRSKLMGAIFETDPKIGSAPAAASVSDRRTLQKRGTVSWSIFCWTCCRSRAVYMDVFQCW